MGKWKTLFSLSILMILIVLMAIGFCLVMFQVGSEIVKEATPVVVGLLK